MIFSLRRETHRLCTYLQDLQCIEVPVHSKIIFVGVGDLYFVRLLGVLYMFKNTHQAGANQIKDHEKSSFVVCTKQKNDTNKHQ